LDLARVDAHTKHRSGRLGRVGDGTVAATASRRYPADSFLIRHLDFTNPYLLQLAGNVAGRLDLGAD